jgi:HAD superfamily hydrolase (TIGR01549 family)
VRRIRAVVFDVGETLVDETRHWGEWADWLGVPRLAFFGALGAVIARGEHHRRVFELVRPGLDLAAETEGRIEAGWRYRIEPADFYPDAIPCLAALKAAGFAIGIAGNQPLEAEAALAAAGVSADFVASSARWGVEKPDPRFFAMVADAVGAPPEAIAYVGDRIDNDVAPAKRAGMFAVFLRRGPWGLIQAESSEAATADLRIDALDDLPQALVALPVAAVP